MLFSFCMLKTRRWISFGHWTLLINGICQACIYHSHSIHFSSLTLDSGRWIMNIFVYVSNNFLKLMTFFTRLKSMTGADVFISIQLKLMHSCWWNFGVGHDLVTFMNLLNQKCNGNDQKLNFILLNLNFNVPWGLNEAVCCEN